MKNEKLIQAFKDEKITPLEKFNTLLNAYSNAGGNRNILRNHNNRGFTAKGLETLEYDVKKHFGISEADIRDYAIPEVEVLNENLRSPEQLDVIAKGAADKFTNILREMDDASKSGLRFRANYPFLSEADTPMEIKSLATDAITSYENYKKAHTDLFDEVANVAEPKISNEEIYIIANGLLGDFETNREVHAELEHYGKTKEILGEHPIFADLKLQRSIDAMSPEELSKRIGNLKTYISKEKKNIEDKKKSDTVRANAQIRKAAFEKEKTLVDAKLAEKK